MTSFISLPRRNILCAGLLLLLATHARLLAQDNLLIPKEVSARAIPVSLSGFTGEVQEVLKTALYVQGFDIVGSDAAQFNISGKNEGAVEGRVTDRVTKATLLANRYESATQRSQAHAFADDVVSKITGRPGVAKSKIAFKAESGGHTEIYISDFDGANAKPATQDNALVAAPCWARGDKLLFYTSYKSGYPDIYSHDLASGRRVPIAKHPGLNTSPAVSPDGRHVAMILSKDGNPELYICDADGTNPKRLTQTRQDESSPCWSPDGQYLCVVSRKDGTPALYRVPISGASMTKIRTAGVGSVTEPDWSPDGKWITFTALTRPFQICVVQAQGGDVNVLVAGEDPSWAPNSRTIIFSKRIGEQRVLSLLDVPTKHVKTLDRYSGSRSQPSWAK